MVLFKINGERNSGTNFVHQLLLKNKDIIFVNLSYLQYGKMLYFFTIFKQPIFI